jgi:hypothetical protein
MSKKLGGITATGIAGITGITATGNNAVDASSAQLHLSGWGGSIGEFAPQYVLGLGFVPHNNDLRDLVGMVSCHMGRPEKSKYPSQIGGHLGIPPNQKGRQNVESFYRTEPRPAPR